MTFANDNDGWAWVRGLQRQQAMTEAGHALGLLEPEPYDPGINHRSRPMTEHEEARFQTQLRQERIDRARASLPSGRSAASRARPAPRLGRSVRSRVETRGDSPGQAQVARIRASGGDARECGRAGCATVSINAEGPADVFCYDHS